MNIIVDESPITPYEIYRRYIYGSPYGRVSISGDVIGPTFIDDKPARLERMFPDGNGRLVSFLKVSKWLNAYTLLVCSA